MIKRKQSDWENNLDILFLTDDNIDQVVGGAEKSTKIIINNIKENFSIGLIQPGSVREPAVAVHYFPLTEQIRLKYLIKTPFSFINYIFKLKRIINSEKPKIIHTQAQASFFIVSLLYKLKIIPENIKFIHTERGLYTKYNNFFKGLLYFSMKELNVLVTTTKFNMCYWKQAIQQGDRNLDLKVIENTAGELFETYDIKKESSNKHRFVIGFAGRYADWKNWPLALKISKKLNASLGSLLRVNMAVGCPDKYSSEETNEMFNELKQVMGSRFNGQINISLQEMDDFYYDLDVFVLTSNYNTESFGRTLVEAMSRKTAVLTTRAGGAVEVVDNNNNVCDTPREFVNRILKLFHDSAALEQEKRINLIKVKEKYSLKNNVNKHINLYNEYL